MIEMLLARIGAAEPPGASCWSDELWRLDREGDQWLVHAKGWHVLSRSERLDRVRLLLTTALSWTGAQTLVWDASKVALDREAMRDCERLWAEHGEVPLLSLVALDPAARDAQGREGVTSVGLAIIAGHEVEALASRESLREQTILVARMVVYMLRHDVPKSGEVKDPRGRVRQFECRHPGYFGANPVIAFDLPLDVDMDQ